MTGVPDSEYVQARRVLLDALGILGAHLPGLILVGAQAVYLHTGAADIAVPEHTTDADMAIAPDLIAEYPLLGDALTDAGFHRGSNPGRWISPDGVYLDLMVPEALAGPGSRGANLGAHGRMAARRARGLEAALIDRQEITLTALESQDDRSYEVWVAGPSALLVAKVIKIDERTGATGRAEDKDALDVTRLLRAVPTDDLATGFTILLDDELSATVTQEAIDALRRLFGSVDTEGVAMAVRAAAPLVDADVLAASIVVLTNDLLDRLPGPTSS
jgi:hypothetical protein